MATKQTTQTQTFKGGDRVSWVATGKVARVEGLAGKRIFGTVCSLSTMFEGDAVVFPDHRNDDKAEFPYMRSSIPTSKLRKENA